MIIKLLWSILLCVGLHFVNPILGLICAVLLFLLYLKRNKKLGFIFISIFLFLNISDYYYQMTPSDQISNIGIVNKAKDNYVIINVLGKNYYVYSKENDLEIGDIVYIEGSSKELSFPCLEGEFDFQKYLNNNSIYYSIEISKVEKKFSNPIRMKKIKNFLFRNLNDNGKDFYSMLFFNENNDLLSLGYLLGLGNLFHISGFLLSSFLMWIDKIKKRFLKDKFPYLSLIICFPILFFSSFSIGNIKAYLLYYDNNLSKKKKGKMKIYSFLIILLLIFNPKYIFLDSFDYIFIFPFLLHFLYDAINSLSHRFKNIGRIFLSYQLIQFMMVLKNKMISPFSFIFIFLFMPMFHIIYFISYLLLFIPFSHIVLNPLSNFFYIMINGLEKILPLFYIDYIYLYAILFIVLFILLILYLEKKETKKSIKFAILVFLLSFTCSSKLLNNTRSYVSFINVGQGDCALIHHHNVDVLIDTGGLKNKDVAKDILIPYLNKRGINDLDLVFLSHDDFDHNGAYISLKDNFKVNKVILGSDFKIVKEQGLSFINLNTFGSGDLDNDDSSVLYFSFLKRNYLFTGDITTSIENKLCSIDIKPVDILKVAHHGSNTSSSLDFLKKINPKEAIISCGLNNIYHHPSDKVIKILNSLNIKIRRTDLEGTIFYDEGIFNIPAFIVKFKEDN